MAERLLKVSFVIIVVDTNAMGNLMSTWPDHVLLVPGSALCLVYFALISMYYFAPTPEDAKCWHLPDRTTESKTKPSHAGRIFSHGTLEPKDNDSGTKQVWSGSSRGAKCWQLKAKIKLSRAKQNHDFLELDKLDRVKTQLLNWWRQEIQSWPEGEGLMWILILTSKNGNYICSGEHSGDSMHLQQKAENWKNVNAYRMLLSCHTLWCGRLQNWCVNIVSFLWDVFCVLCTSPEVPKGTQCRVWKGTGGQQGPVS